MNILTIVKIAWRNLWRSKLRSSVVILSVIFGIKSKSVIIFFLNFFNVRAFFDLFKLTPGLKTT